LHATKHPYHANTFNKHDHTHYDRITHSHGDVYSHAHRDQLTNCNANLYLYAYNN
jgi:hypothetical protein